MLMKEKSEPLDPRILQICERLKSIRIERGFPSYENFAYENDLGRMSVWRVEQGSNLTIKTLLKYLDIHQMTLEEFFLYELKQTVPQNGNVKK